MHSEATSHFEMQSEAFRDIRGTMKAIKTTGERGTVVTRRGKFQSRSYFRAGVAEGNAISAFARRIYRRRHKAFRPDASWSPVIDFLFPLSSSNVVGLRLNGTRKTLLFSVTELPEKWSRIAYHQSSDRFETASPENRWKEEGKKNRSIVENRAKLRGE